MGLDWARLAVQCGKYLDSSFVPTPEAGPKTVEAVEGGWSHHHEGTTLWRGRRLSRKREGPMTVYFDAGQARMTWMVQTFLVILLQFTSKCFLLLLSPSWPLSQSLSQNPHE